MRVTNSQSYDEPRDSIAQDWPRYIKYLFPKSKYFFIPNIEEDAVDYCIKNNINLLILTGGDNIGFSKKRDNTELILLEFIFSNNIPVIGICRGMQLIHHFLGGDLIDGGIPFVKQHRVNKHKVRFDKDIITVNSFHTLMINEKTLSPKLSILARNVNDNSIEAFIGPKTLGLMWHPEREIDFCCYTKGLINKFLSENV